MSTQKSQKEKELNVELLKIQETTTHVKKSRHV